MNPKALSFLLLIPSIGFLIWAIIFFVLSILYYDLLFLIYMNISISWNILLCFIWLVCPSQFCFRSSMFFGWRFLFYSRHIPQVNQYIRLQSHVSQRLSLPSQVAFSRGGLRFSLSLPVHEKEGGRMWSSLESPSLYEDISSHLYWLPFQQANPLFLDSPLIISHVMS